MNILKQICVLFLFGCVKVTWRLHTFRTLLFPFSMTHTHQKLESPIHKLCTSLLKNRPGCQWARGKVICSSLSKHMPASQLLLFTTLRRPSHTRTQRELATGAQMASRSCGSNEQCYRSLRNPFQITEQRKAPLQWGCWPQLALVRFDPRPCCSLLVLALPNEVPGSPIQDTFDPISPSPAPRWQR